jgi:diaminohydroxyphosphoribosylaminopyrimidine deaminase/5-amino-6-(5-phosphoribosylamino)uracil reductase
VAAFSAFDESCMRQALVLAERGLYSTDPNPRVGCVIARGEEVVAEGWHRRAGEPHAEALALAAAATLARGATLYLTLEPCSHQGRTPPCVDAVIRAGLARVVCAHQDPNPRVNGRGLERMRRAGITVETGLLAERARALNPGFIKRHERGKPWVRVKLAASLDARTALADGASRWITGVEARADVQHWRARSSAVITGIGTVLADDPRLDVRISAGGEPPRQPLRIVLDSRHQIPRQARVLAPPGECWICVAAGQGRSTDRSSGATLIELPRAGQGLDLEALLTRLVEREANEVLVEAGPRVAGAFLAQRLVDELILYVAPRLFGSGARPLVELPAIGRIEDGLRFSFRDIERVGEDLRIIATPRAG